MILPIFECACLPIRFKLLEAYELRVTVLVYEAAAFCSELNCAGALELPEKLVDA